MKNICLLMLLFIYIYIYIYIHTYIYIKIEGAVAITDRMRYGVKPSAVRSENYLLNIKPSNGSNFNCTLGQDIIFDVPALGNGYYCDFPTSYIRFRVDVTLSNKLTQVEGSCCCGCC